MDAFTDALQELIREHLAAGLKKDEIVSIMQDEINCMEEEDGEEEEGS